MQIQKVKKKDSGKRIRPFQSEKNRKRQNKTETSERNKCGTKIPKRNNKPTAILKIESFDNIDPAVIISSLSKLVLRKIFPHRA